MIDLNWLGLGNWGERTAGRWLRRQGLRILRHSYRCSIGEIDLIAQDGPTLVFVEVKTRTSDQHGQPWEAVTADKRRRITKTAVFYLKHVTRRPCPVRFDVVGITLRQGWFARPVIQHFADAFPAEGPWSI